MINTSVKPDVEENKMRAVVCCRDKQVNAALALNTGLKPHNQICHLMAKFTTSSLFQLIKNNHWRQKLTINQTEQNAKLLVCQFFYVSICSFFMFLLRPLASNWEQTATEIKVKILLTDMYFSKSVIVITGVWWSFWMTESACCDLCKCNCEVRHFLIT